MKRVSIAALLVLLAFIQGCIKTDDNRFTGTIAGFINPVDESGTVVTDKGGVTVTVEGTDLAGLTDTNGRYEISGVPVGSYPLNCTKDGYGTYRINSVIVAGGEVPVVLEPSALYQKPTLTISNVAYSNYYLQGWYKINISGSITPTGKYSLMACAGTYADVSDSHFDKVMIANYYAGIETNQFSVSLSFDENIYRSGQNIYVVLYLLNVKDKYSYYNSLTDSNVYQSAVKASDVQMITL